MKTKLSKNWVAGAVAAIISLTGGTGFVVNAQDQPPPPSATDNPTADNATALPPGVDPSSPLAEVIRLAQSGVSETVITSYVNNSTSPFSLNADQIIYLKDIGVPDEIVQAMIQRDQTLQQQGYQTPPQPAPAPATTVVDTTYVAAPPPEVTVDYFQGALSPYGSWVYIEGYGRCWRPTVVVYDSSWSPYCDHGHWIWTDRGWYWISDYSWGWAPFHYGRWFRDVRLGWCWYPDTVWGPSWVTWRYSDNYCGWAPLPPRCVYREGVGFFFNGVSVGINFDFGLSVNCFTFVPTRNFCDSRPWHYRVAPREVTQIYNNTTIINNFNVDREHRTFVNHGIDPDRITRVTHRDIHPVTIRDTTDRVRHGEQLGRDGHTLMVNRPHFSDNPPRPGQGGPQHSTQPPPVVGSPHQPPHNGNENRNPQPPGHNQPATPPVLGSPNQPPHNGNANDNSQSPRNYHPTPNGPGPGNPNQPSHNGNQNNNPRPPGQQQNLPVTPPGSPGHNQTTPTSPSPVNRYAPITPVQPQAPNYNSPDNRRYPSPRTQQSGQQNPQANPGGNNGRYAAPVTPQAPVTPPQANHYSPPTQPSPSAPPQRNYGTPVIPPSTPAPPPQRNYSAPVTPPPAPPVQAAPPAQPQPRYEAPQNNSRPNDSQPNSGGNQSGGGSASQGQSQNSGGGRNHNGR